MRPSKNRTLRDWLGEGAHAGGQVLKGLEGEVALAALAAGGSGLAGRAAELAGSSVLIATRDQLAAAVSLIELDGVVRRLILYPPDVAFEHLPSVIARAAVDAIVTDQPPSNYRGLGVPSVSIGHELKSTPRPARAVPATETDWILLTSGTTGGPKLVKHNLASLTAWLEGGKQPGAPVVWSTFYDIRRYGGLQIFLRAILGGTSLILSSAGETIHDHLARLRASAATHVTGTPSHWRRVLMSGSAEAIAPRYVRLSGEIADQAVLDSLRARYPQATVAHAYASTEAGVAFEVEDGREGFPAYLLDHPNGRVTLKIQDDSLRIRSRGAAACYLGDGDAPLTDADGFVDTGDMVERRGERYYFVGRRGGIINVGGLKVHPEEVEAAINRHPSVRMSLVMAKKSPITGAVIVADVVLTEDLGDESEGVAELRREILQLCRERLPEHKVPAAIRFVPALKVAATGKVLRNNA